MEKNDINCNVCNFKQKQPPWGRNGESPTYSICPCCGVEFGYEDSSEQGLESYRINWIKMGCVWFDESEKPDNWSLGKQWKLSGHPL